MNSPLIIADPQKSIYLKAIEWCDIDFYYSVYGDAQMMKYIGQPMAYESACTQLKLTVATMSKSHPEHLTFVILDSQSNTAIGIIGLTWHDLSNRNTAEIGVMVIKKWRRQSVAHQAKEMMIEYGFNHLLLEKIIAWNQQGNVAAIEANKKLKFQPGTGKKNNRTQIKMRLWSIERSMWNDS